MLSCYVLIDRLKGLCHPTRMREPMKTNLKKSARLFQVVSEILEGCFYLSNVFTWIYCVLLSAAVLMAELMTATPQ